MRSGWRDTCTVGDAEAGVKAGDARSEIPGDALECYIDDGRSQNRENIALGRRKPSHTPVIFSSNFRPRAEPEDASPRGALDAPLPC